MAKNDQENIKPIAKLLGAVRDVIERDVKLGLYESETLRLTVEARKEVVKQLTDQGLSTREIAKTIGIDKRTVGRDLERGKVPQKAGQNAPPESPNKKSTEEQQIQERIEQAKAEARAEIQVQVDLLTKNLEDRQQYISGLEANIKEHTREKKVQQDISEKLDGNFRKQSEKVVEALAAFIQHDNLAKMLSDLEIIKENVTSETDAQSLRNVIQSLVSLSQRAKSWAERVTPINNKWKYEV